MIQTIVKVELPVEEHLSIQKHRIEPVSGSNGKRISIVTGIHGDELEGQYVCFAVQRRLREHPEYLRGTVDIYPAMNPLGIDTVMRGIPAFDLDMNRIFPGREDGDMNEHIASELIRDLKGSTLCLDIHASNIYLTEIPQIRINELFRDSLVPLAMHANVDFIWVHGASTVLESTLAHSLNSCSTPTLVVEMGVGMRITRDYGEQLTDGIFRLMQQLGIWDGPTSAPRMPVICEDSDEVSFLNAPLSGIFIKEKPHGVFVTKGEPLGYIVDPLRGEILSTITAPRSGWLFTIREYPVVDQGSLIARIFTRKLEALHEN